MWNLIYILFFFLASKLNITKNYFRNNPDFYVSSWNIIDYFKAFVGYGRISNHPICGPFWFVRDLILFSIFTPIIIKVFNKAPFFIFLFSFSIYTLNLPFLIDKTAFFYLILGFFYSKFYDNIKNYELNWYFPFFFLIIYFILYLINIIHVGNFIEFLNVLFLWELAKKISYNDNILTFQKKLAVFSFFTFGIHQIIMMISKQLLVKLFGLGGFNFILVWTISNFITLFLSLLIGYICKKALKPVWFTLNGGR